MPTYKIIRHYFLGKNKRCIKRDLTLTEAQAHCSDPETSSTTAKSSAALRITRRNGPWFDSYTQER